MTARLFTRTALASLLGLGGFALSRASLAQAAVAQNEGRFDLATEPRAITLEEAIAYARAHQPAVRLALSRIATREAEADIPKSEWLPKVGVAAQLFAATANNTTGTYVAPGSNIDIPRIGGTRSVRTGNMRPYPSTVVAIGITQELFDFGRIAAATAARDGWIGVEREGARGVSLRVVCDVEEAYFAVLAAKAILQASQDAVERSRAHRDFAKAGVNAGLRSPIELTRAEADLARFDIGRLRARGGLAAAQTTLAATVGVEEAALDASAAPASPNDLPRLEAAIAQASARDPRILAKVAALHAEEAQTRAIGAELRPDVGFTATFSGRAGGAPPSGNGEVPEQNGWLPAVPNWDVGVVLSWPIFDGTVLARESASSAAEQNLREDIKLLRHDSAAEIRRSYAAVDIARLTLPGLQRAVDAARANYAQAEARFRSGLSTSIELADAEALRTEAEIQLALGQFDLVRARAEFGRAIAENV